MVTYFTFADGAFRYDCVTCGAKCCKGYGIGLDRAMAERLAAERSALRPFVRASGGGTLIAQNVTDGCWFLDAERLCALERAGGRDAKPPACRLFPFNRLFVVGEIRVVDLNTLLCPLEDARGAGVTHAELSRELEALGDRATWVPAAPPPGRDAAAAIADEQAAALACADAVRREEPDFAVVAAAMEGTGARALADLRIAAARLLGLDPGLASDASPATCRVAALVAPSLRFNVRFATAPATPAHGIDSGAGGGESPTLLARTLVALELVLRAAAALSPAPVTVRAATELFGSRRVLLSVLARASERPSLDPSAGLQLRTGAPAELQGALFRLAGALARNRSAGRTVGDLLEEVAPDPLARVLLVPYAAELLASARQAG